MKWIESEIVYVAEFQRGLCHSWERPFFACSLYGWSSLTRLIFAIRRIYIETHTNKKKQYDTNGNSSNSFFVCLNLCVTAVFRPFWFWMTAKSIWNSNLVAKKVLCYKLDRRKHIPIIQYIHFWYEMEIPYSVDVKCFFVRRIGTATLIYQLWKYGVTIPINPIHPNRSYL